MSTYGTSQTNVENYDAADQVDFICRSPLIPWMQIKGTVLGDEERELEAMLDSEIEDVLRVDAPGPTDQVTPPN